MLLFTLIGCNQSSEVELARSETCSVADPPAAIAEEVRESSGAVFGRLRPDLVWTHNDSGGEPWVYALDARGTVVGGVRVSGAENDDWEDIAAAPCTAGSCLFIGDIGDNAGDRSEIVVYVIPEPDPGDSGSASATVYRVSYPDEPQDAEALFLSPAGVLHIVTKGGGGPVTLYRYPTPLNPDETVTLERVRSLSAGPVPLGDRVTAADVTPDGEWLLLRTYTAMLAYRLSSFEDETAQPVRIELTALAPGQGEGIAAGSGGKVALTSESLGTGFPGSLVFLECPFLGGTALAESFGG